jgi:hypothetical protein
VALRGVPLMAAAIEWLPWNEKPAIKRRGPHTMTRQILKWPFCARCGLILLRNPASKQAEKQPCEWEE